MAKRKITIELSDETIAVIERLKVDELSLEEVIPHFIDAGIVDAITSGESTNPLARLMDRIMSSFTGSNKGKVDADVPKVIVEGRKGGSNIATTLCNAIMTLDDAIQLVPGRDL